MLGSVLQYLLPVLQSFANIFSLLQSVKARDEGRGEVAAATPPSQEEPRARPRNPPTATHGYSRYDQERYKGKEGGRGR